MITKYQEFNISKLIEEGMEYSIDAVCGVGSHDKVFDVVGYRDCVEFSGWCFQKTGQLFNKLFAKINNRLYAINKSQERADVARHFGHDKIDNCGFQLSLNVLELESYNFTFTLIGKDTSGNCYSSKEYYVRLITQEWYTFKESDSGSKLYSVIKQKEQEIANLHEVIYNKNKQLFGVYNSITWKLNKYLFSIVGKHTKKKETDTPVIYSDEPTYNEFLRRNQITDFKIIELLSRIRSLKYLPKISIVVPVYNVSPYFLDKCIQSVLNQFYDNWELCLYDDASTDTNTIARLKYWAKTDERIKVLFGEENGHISHASNKAIEMASGEFISLLDNDDELTVDALAEVVFALNRNPELDFIYSDEDKIISGNKLTSPYFKPDFSLDMLLSSNYICHFTTIRKTVGDKVGWFRKGYEGAQDHDLFLRLVQQTSNIHHIPKVLYHWRISETSTAAGGDKKDYAHEAGLKAVQGYFERENIKATVTGGYLPGTYRIKRQIVGEPQVSIIIPFKDQVELLKNCLESILKKTSYSNYKILLVSNNSKEEETFNFLKYITSQYDNIRYLEYNIPFNYSAINNWAVTQVEKNTEYILLLNNDVEIITKDWLAEMLQNAQRSDVGAVGARLLYDDGTVQHAGVIIGLGGVAGHSHKYYPRDSHGYYGRLSFVSNYSACTAACLLVRKNVYEEVGGLNENELKVAFNDVDFCLKIRKAGYLIVYTPYAELYHYESKSRGFEDTPEKLARFNSEIDYIQKVWQTHLVNDPYYSPNLSKSHEDFSLNL